MNGIFRQLSYLREQEFFAPLDVQLAEFVGRVAGSQDHRLLLAAALASKAVGEGDVCLDLSRMAGRDIIDGAGDCAPLSLPSLAEWRKVLRSPGAASCIGGPGDSRCLVLDGDRLYLRRYWLYERQVVDGLIARTAPDPAAIPPAVMEERLPFYFPEGEGAEEKREAARKSCKGKLSLITGGPGTGKTYTVARVVALLAASRPPGSPPLKVRLAAPTGKAASRVQESIRSALDNLPGLDEEIKRQVPASAVTLHRLLGWRPDSPYFRHDHDNPLDADLLIVDEASMMDLPMTAKLLQALNPRCRLILVGDGDQLASVEPGNVFGDICAAASRNQALAGCVTRLAYSFRFAAGSRLGALSAAVRGGDHAAAVNILRQPGREDIRFFSPVHRLYDGRGVPCSAFRTAIAAGFRPYLQATTPEEALRLAGHFRVLAAIRGGPLGITRLNHEVERILAADGLGRTGSRSTPAIPRSSRSDLFYDHRMIMVTVNDYSLRLYNGDLGVIMTDPAEDRLYAYFEPEAGAGEGACRRLAVSLLPAHETAFAMTIHKAQGSEFDRILMVLPADPGLPLLTRELLYTGITRTRGPLDLWCDEKTLSAVIQRPAGRATGLAAALASPGSPPPVSSQPASAVQPR